MIKPHVGESVGLLINRIKQKLKCRMADKLKRYDMTTEQRAILVALAEKGAMTQSKLCEMTGSEPSNMCITLKRLIAKGLVQKVDHPNDARAYLVEATKKAVELVPTLQVMSFQISSTLTDGISREDLETTMRTLKKMQENLQ